MQNKFTQKVSSYCAEHFHDFYGRDEIAARFKEASKVLPLDSENLIGIIVSDFFPIKQDAIAGCTVLPYTFTFIDDDGDEVPMTDVYAVLVTQAVSTVFTVTVIESNLWQDADRTREVFRFESGICAEAEKAFASQRKKYENASYQTYEHTNPDHITHHYDFEERISMMDDGENDVSISLNNYASIHERDTEWMFYKSDKVETIDLETATRIINAKYINE